MLTGLTGNGLYKVGAAMLLRAGHNESPSIVLLLGSCVLVAGTALSIATLVGSGLNQAPAAGTLLPAIVLRCAATGRWFFRPRSAR